MPVVVQIVQAPGEGGRGTSTKVLLSLNSRDPAKGTFDGTALRLMAVTSLLYVNRARLGLGMVIAENRAVFGFEFKSEQVDGDGAMVPETASCDQARPIRTRRMIICGERHCTGYEAEKNWGSAYTRGVERR